MAEAHRPGPEPAEDVEASAAAAEAATWVGAKLDEMNGTSVGRVEGLLVDARDGATTWILVRLGRFGRRCAIPVDFVAAGVGHVWVPFTREVLRAASEINPSGGLSSADERVLAEGYGITEGAGRLAELEGLSDEEPGSVPIA